MPEKKNEVADGDDATEGGDAANKSISSPLRAPVLDEIPAAAKAEKYAVAAAAPRVVRPHKQGHGERNELAVTVVLASKNTGVANAVAAVAGGNDDIDKPSDKGECTLSHSSLRTNIQSSTA